MSKSYAQILQQIESLKAEAESARRKEIEGVVARIKEAIAVYGLTADDLGFNDGQKPLTVSRRAGAASRKRAEKTRSEGSRPVRYRDEAGNTWGGRGPRPRWLRNALASGKTLQDLEV
jgi:DNA-binding protein H-NS